MQLIISIIMIAVSITGVVMFGVPQYNAMREHSAHKAEYETVLVNARKLETTRDDLSRKYSALDQQQLQRLEKMLPDSPQNVPLILELDALARQYGLSLQNVKIEDLKKDQVTKDAKRIAGDPGPDIGILGIDFVIVGPYVSLTEFVRNAEKNLRVVDLQKVSFTSLDDKENYQYAISLRTYWLK